jgi:hypothetical protein
VLQGRVIEIGLFVLVWLGAILMLGSAFLSVLLRARDLRVAKVLRTAKAA